MSPLEALTEGIRNLADGKFNKNLTVRSGDEFEEVADAFNQMSARIGHQFDTLSTLAEIDRLILSRPRPEQVINITLSGIGKIIRSDSAGIVLFGEDGLTGQLLGRSNGERESKIIGSITMPLEQQFTVRQERSFLISKSDSSFGWLKESLPQFDMHFFLVLPVVKGDDLFALLILGFKQKKPSVDNIAGAEEFTDRISVAFSNAAWEEKLYYQAHYDVLTGLPNRLLLQDRITQEISHAARNKAFLTILFLDLDRFKKVNDSLGHATGDAMLTIMASRLQKCLRTEDTVARLGGDEFIIMISGMPSREIAAANASTIAEKMLQNISKPLTLKQQEIIITGSIGIATYPTDGEDTEILLRNADIAMYQAKKEGSGKFYFYSDELNDQAIHRLSMETKLHHALAEDQFLLYFQPKVEINTRTVTSCEALIRWVIPNQGIVYPNEFIPMIDEIGLSVPVGKWVLHTACKQAKQWQSGADSPIAVSVNISAIHFHRGDLVKHVQEALQLSGLNPSCLDLEITESAAMHDTERTISILLQLRDMGVTISIDDYGTGHSSLKYLTSFPVTTLKIDRGFIHQIPEKQNYLSIVSSTILLAHNLGLRVIAEGVETEEQLNCLKEMGCDEFQGYLCSPPVPIQDFLSFLPNKLCAL